KPEERRLVFEEAAGITRFRVRGQEAGKKLEKTEENMRNVEGILDEVRRRYDSLKLQAEKAEAYRELREETFEVELEIQLLRLKGLLEDKRKREGRLSEKEKSRDEIKTAIDAENASVSAAANLVTSMESRLVESQKKTFQLEMEKKARENQIRLFRERIVELESAVEGNKGRERSTTEKLKEISANAESTQASLEERTRRIDETEDIIGQLTRDVGSFAERVKANEERIRSNASAVARRESELEVLRAELRAITEDIVTTLDARLREAGYSSAELHAVEKEILDTLQSLRIEMDGGVSTLQGAMADSRFDGIVREITRTFTASLEKIAALEGLLARYRRFVPTFLDELLSPEGIITRKRRVDRKISESTEAMTRFRQESESLGLDNEALRQKIEEHRKTLEDLRIDLARQQTEKAAIQEEIARLTRERAEQESLVKEVSAQIEQTLRKRGEMDERIAAVEEECARFDSEEQELQTALSGLEGQIASQHRELLGQEQKLKEKGVHLSRVQSEIEKMQIEVAEIRTEIRDVHTTFMERFSRDLSEYETRIPDLVPSRDLRPRLAALREETRKLGQVNLMAPEEFAEVKDRFDFLSGQLGDLTRAREDLKKVTTAIQTESTELFLDTYNRVKKTFHVVFRRLFGGGRADLRLENPDAPLDSGIEILVQPPGKKLEDINLLSGGERSLTGVTLLFAIYMVKPSPFCLLDEIDAALDEENVNRLSVLLKEFSTSSQFIVISHNKRTVAWADVLYGVTMEESGVSKLIAVRLKNSGSDVTVRSASGDGQGPGKHRFGEASWPSPTDGE
ncbi:MAG TPA: chromosome segregation protein SMC, partial [Thermodesulfobacteriota bacterium]|nr:chromosome segregation protein SMC [Thermodesulfobacteriota bacterium]